MTVQLCSQGVDAYPLGLSEAERLRDAFPDQAQSRRAVDHAMLFEEDHAHAHFRLPGSLDHFSLLLAVGMARAGDVYVQTNLVTNNQSVVQAQQTDPNLINPWEFSFSTSSPLWVSDQGSGTATVYQLTGNTSSPTLLTVGILQRWLEPRGLILSCRSPV